MMGFFDKVKKAFGSKKENVESQDSVNDGVIDEATFTASIENDNESLNENEEINSEDSEETPANEDLIDKQTPNDKIRNFKYLDELIHSGANEIVLDSDIVLNDDEKSLYENGIRIDVDNLIIDGNGHSIDAKNKTRILKIYSKVTIKNLTLKNGHAIDGGAINIQKGDVDITSCQFQDNTADNHGGAILNWGKLTLAKTIFKGNSTQKKSGGAINIQKGDVDITACQFQENTSKDSGGAILNWGKLTLVQTIFKGNSTQEKDGGAINIREGDVDISGCQFQENSANHNGGAIHSTGELTISESTLNNNTAQGTGFYSGGGAIYNQNGELTITESTLTENTTQIRGGAIYNYGKLNIENSILKENIAYSKEHCEGGAIYNSDGDVNIIKSSLLNNKSIIGGAISNSSKMSIRESTLNENQGGAIYNEYDLKIYDSVISNHKTPGNIILNKDSLQVYNTIFKNNQSRYIIYNSKVSKSKVTESTSYFFNCRIIENTVNESLIFNEGKSCTIEENLFENNILNKSLNIINESELTLINPKIKDNGKTILNQKYVFIKKSPPKLENKIFGKGTVEIYEKFIPQGEKFDFEYLDIKIHECNSKKIILNHDILFENYEMDFYEGGIELDIDDLVIDGNGHTINGADKSRIFIITGKNITLKNIVFKNGRTHKNYDNPLNNNGGAIKINHDNNIIIENCEFINNTSEKGGGAVYNGGGELTINGSTLNNNTSQDGGGAVYNGGGELTITSSTLQENTSQGDGGAICNRDGELTIIKSAIAGNTGGEAIFNSSKMSIRESTLNENQGGAINNRDGELTIIKSTIAENTTKYGGGAIFNYRGELTITGSTLSGNTAEYGGAIDNREAELTVTKSILTGNLAQKYGGAIYHFSGELTISDSTLTRNTAKESGGAICLAKSKYFREKELKYESENCTFKDNNPDDVYEEKD